VSLSAPPAIGPALTVYAAALSGVDASDQVLASINDGTTGNLWSVRRTASAATALLTASATSAQLDGAMMPVSAPHKLAASYQVGSQALVLNGDAAITGTSALAPVGLSSINIGHDAGGSAPFNGYIRRVAVWPDNRISDAGLQALTAP
jgi:hypothetical protein